MYLKKIRANLREKVSAQKGKVIAGISGLTVFGNAWAIDNESSLWTAYNLITDMVDVVDPLVTLALKFVGLIIAFILIGFLRDLFKGVTKNMRI